jgi:hypothetical protein
MLVALLGLKQLASIAAARIFPKNDLYCLTLGAI